VNTPLLTSADIDSALEVLKSGWISSSGPAVSEFEFAWATYCGRKFGVAVSNGTAALELSIRALDIGPGDEVIIPSFTIISCASAVVLSGATPVFVDVKLEDGCIDVSLIEAAISKRTKAIMAVHIYGYGADMFRIEEIAREYDLKVIEDAAEMHGGELISNFGLVRRAGNFGEISTFSFFVNKSINTGEGGMVLTDDPIVYEKLLLLRNLGFTEPRFFHKIQGFNYRLTAIQAALGLSQIKRIDSILAIKQATYEAYMSHLNSVCDEINLPIYPRNLKSSYWVFPVLAKDAAARTRITTDLAKSGIETRNFFIGLHSQPVLQGKIRTVGNFTHTEILQSTGFYLPSGVGISESQIEDVCTNLIRILQKSN
jgi:perosamine synthetase